MERKKLIVGNWKMHKKVREALELVEGLLQGLPETPYEVAVAPPFTALYAVSQRLRDDTRIKLGAQNVFYKPQGAFTGEVSPPMLKELGVTYVIVGHSERRKYFGETDEMVRQKVQAVLDHGMQPILCVGETLEEREHGLAKVTVERQIREALFGLEASQVKNVVIAYEPVWAIGTGVNATPEQAQEMHAFIRELLAELYGEALARERTILYGGSVKPGNIGDLSAQPDVDGALVGGASLEAQLFLGIIRNAQ